MRPKGRRLQAFCHYSGRSPASGGSRSHGGCIAMFLRIFRSTGRTTRRLLREKFLPTHQTPTHPLALPSDLLSCHTLSFAVQSRVTPPRTPAPASTSGGQRWVGGGGGWGRGGRTNTNDKRKNQEEEEKNNTNNKNTSGVKNMTKK